MTGPSPGGRWQLRFAFADAPVADAPPASGVERAGIHSDAVRAFRDELPALLPGEYRQTPGKQTRVRHPRTSTSLPVPKPLPEAVAAGHFGHDERGRPIRPSRDEVREITAGHAETLRNLVQDERQEAFENGITQYAGSFGTEAAERLRSHVKHLARESVGPTWRR